MIDVSCIGILVADVLAKPVDTIPKRGLLGLIDQIELHSGGCAMSAAIDMSIIGVNTAVLGKIGNDSFGGFLKNTLIQNRVNTDGLIIDSKNQTSSSVVLSDSTGERTFLHCVGANGSLSKEDINWSVIKESKLVFVAGTFLMDTFDGEHCASVLKKCKELGKITVLDTAWDSKGRWMSVLRQCMPYIDLFLPSIEEAKELSGKSELDEIANVFFDYGVKQLVIKLGSKGCYLRESRQSPGLIIPTYDVEVVDTTGAGDSFCAGFISAMLKGKSFEECGKFANAVGTFCVSSKGATTGIKPMNDILKFMEAQK